MTQRKGFTLIELLVVVAIISLLVTIMSPALIQIVRYAKRAVCSTRLENIGDGAVAYAASNDENLPFRADGSSIVSYVGRNHMTYQDTNIACFCNSRVWYMLVAEGMISPADFICPADPMGKAIVADGGAYDFFPGEPGHQEYRPLSYSMQVSISYHKANKPYEPNNSRMCKPVTMLHNTALVIGADSNGLTEWVPSSYWRIDRNSVGLDPNNPDLMNSENHDRKGQCVLYLDSHVSWEESPYCGIDGDLIWTRRGSTNPNVRSDRPADAEDTCAI